jgi:hypothetical protein
MFEQASLAVVYLGTLPMLLFSYNLNDGRDANRSGLQYRKKNWKVHPV